MTDFDYEQELPLTDDIPRWITQLSWTGQEVKDLAEYGCGKCCYRPAVINCEALKTMGEYGDDVLEYLEEMGAASTDDLAGFSWSGMAVEYLSTAVETWASSVLSRIEEGDFDPELVTCPSCNGQAPTTFEGTFHDCKRCDGTGEVVDND